MSDFLCILEQVNGGIEIQWMCSNKHYSLALLQMSLTRIQSTVNLEICTDALAKVVNSNYFTPLFKTRWMVKKEM